MPTLWPMRPALRLSTDGQILDAGWTRGVEQTIGWAGSAAGDGDAVMFADGPLIVRNESGQHLCETQVGQRCGRWKVSANTTNIHSARLAGVRFLRPAAPASLQRRVGWLPPSRGAARCGSHPQLWYSGTPGAGLALSMSHRPDLWIMV